ncbi:hypothetical protein ACXYMP_05650 [Aliiroseovarius sp. CAU 1755]
MKDAGLRIRIDRELREQFLNACREDDKPAAQVLREFMRSYVAARAETSSDQNAPAAKQQEAGPK